MRPNRTDGKLCLAASQGYSKEASSRCGDGPEPVLGEDLVDLGEGLGEILDDGRHGVSERRRSAGVGSGSDGNMVLV